MLYPLYRLSLEVVVYNNVIVLLRLWTFKTFPTRSVGLLNSLTIILLCKNVVNLHLVLQESVSNSEIRLNTATIPKNNAFVIV